MCTGISPGERVIFRYKDKLLFFTGLVVIICICALIEIGLLRMGSGLDWLYFLIGALFFIFVVSVLTISGRSDVVIDEAGIYRIIFGVTLQEIAWECIEMITAFPVSGGSGYQARAFNLFPKAGANVSLFPFGKFFFDDKLIDCENLIVVINFYAKKNKITLKERKKMLGDLVPVDSF